MPLIVFFLLFLAIVKNKKLHHFVRFNCMQVSICQPFVLTMCNEPRIGQHRRLGDLLLHAQSEPNVLKEKLSVGEYIERCNSNAVMRLALKS